MLEQAPQISAWSRLEGVKGKRGEKRHAKRRVKNVRHLISG